jgi:hypothetical protein
MGNKNDRRKAFSDVVSNCECDCFTETNGLALFMAGTFHLNESKEITLLVDKNGQVRLPDEVGGPIMIHGLCDVFDRRRAFEVPASASRALALLEQLMASGYCVLQPELPQEEVNEDGEVAEGVWRVPPKVTK